MNLRRILFYLFLAFVLAGAAGAYALFWLPNTFENDRFVIVSRGESFAQVAASLDQAGILRSRHLFDAAGRLLDLTTKMRIGKYRFKSGMSNKDILEDLREGNTVELISVTLPEGSRITRQAHIFARLLGIDSARYASLAFDSAFAAKLNVRQRSLEGYLLPGTYRFYWQSDEAEIMAGIVREFWKFFSDSLAGIAAARNRSVHDVLTLASIVELETSIDSERAVIAGVYLNRLKKNMRLQADPTVEYALEGGPRRLYYSDLQRESEYNTYLHRGLPPGPITNPGKVSILAALNPAKNKFLFFVATGEGGHSFTRTYDEHLKARRKFLRHRAERQAAKQEG